jgi:pentatricopeptide repeat protein
MWVMANCSASRREIPKRDVNSWNSMILGLAMHGKAKAALEYFDHMIGTERFLPNSITTWCFGRT